MLKNNCIKWLLLCICFYFTTFLNPTYLSTRTKKVTMLATKNDEQSRINSNKSSVFFYITICLCYFLGKKTRYKPF